MIILIINNFIKIFHMVEVDHATSPSVFLGGLRVYIYNLVYYAVIIIMYKYRIKCSMFNRRRGRVGKGMGDLDHVWSYGVREVVTSIPDRGNIVGWVFHPNRWLARFSLIWKCLSFQMRNLFRTLSSWGSCNYRPSATLLYEVASHVKQLPFQPLLLLMFNISFISHLLCIFHDNILSILEPLDGVILGVVHQAL